VSAKRRQPPPRLALTATEAPDALGVSWDFFREHIVGELRWVRRGRVKLVAVTEVQRWLDENADRLPLAELEQGRVRLAEPGRDRAAA
jgi:hypothetical protein